MAKKILVAAGLYPPDIGGPATYAHMLEERLPQHNIEVAVRPFGQVRHLPVGLRHITYAYNLWHESKAYDAIYALDAVSVGLPAWFVSFVTKKPLLIRLGGDYAWEQGSQRFGLNVALDEYTRDRSIAAWPVKVLARIQDFVVARATNVIVPSYYLKNIVSTWRGVDPNRIAVIYSALFPLEVNETRDTLRRELNYHGFTVISAARLVPWKGFSALLEVLARLVADDAETMLVIAGEGPEQRALVEKARVLGVTDHVRFVGSLSKGALGASIKAADVFVLNSGYEGLSHQLIEVMDLEVPIVTTRVGGNIELIKDQETGVLVPHNDVEAIYYAVVSLKQQQELREQLTAKAKQKVADFQPERVMVQLVDVITSL